MKILVAVASEKEYNLLIEEFEKDADFQKQGSLFILGNLNIEVLRHGTGILMTTYHLQHYLLTNEMDLAFQLGIGGSSSDISIGSAFVLAQEEMGDMGVWENGYFKTIFDLGLENPDQSPFTDGLLYSDMPIEYWNSHPQLPSMTVNSLLDDPEWSEERLASMDAKIENMEGAAFYYVCKMLCVPSLEIRGVSNHVGIRDKSTWKIEEAMKTSYQLWKKILLKIQSDAA